MRTVREIMTTTVHRIHCDTTVREAEGIFISHKISGAPVVDDSGAVVGFVSKSDIIRFDSTGEDPVYARVAEIANRKVIAVFTSTSTEDAARKMLHEHVHHLVVMDGEVLVGLLSAFDFVELVASNATED